MTTIESAPVFLAAEGPSGAGIVVSAGGIPLLVSGEADAATNAETQALLRSADQPQHPRRADRRRVLLPHRRAQIGRYQPPVRSERQEGRDVAQHVGALLPVEDGAHGRTRGGRRHGGGGAACPTCRRRSSAATWTRSRSGSRRRTTPNRRSAPTPSSFRIGRCTGSSSTSTRRPRFSPIPRGAARSWPPSPGSSPRRSR